jgi:hypothetical protein
MVKLEMNNATKRAIGRAAEARNFVALLQGETYLVISGKSEAEYNVTFTKRDGAAWAECSCPAGKKSQTCHHVISAGWLHKGIVRMRRRAN